MSLAQNGSKSDLWFHSGVPPEVVSTPQLKLANTHARKQHLYWYKND